MDAPTALRDYRSKHGLTLEQLAASFGVNKTTVLRWEEGVVPAERVIEIERATGVPRHELRPDLYPEPVSEKAS